MRRIIAQDGTEMIFSFRVIKALNMYQFLCAIKWKRDKNDEFEKPTGDSDVIKPRSSHCAIFLRIKF